MLSSSGACVSGEWRAAPALNTGVGELVAPPAYEEVMEMGDMGVVVVAALATDAVERR